MLLSLVFRITIVQFHRNFHAKSDNLLVVNHGNLNLCSGSYSTDYLNEDEILEVNFEGSAESGVIAVFEDNFSSSTDP